MTTKHLDKAFLGTQGHDIRNHHQPSKYSDSSLTDAGCSTGLGQIQCDDTEGVGRQGDCGGLSIELEILLVRHNLC